MTRLKKLQNILTDTAYVLGLMEAYNAPGEIIVLERHNEENDDMPKLKEGCLYLRKDGRWEVKIRRNEKYYSFYDKDKNEAIRKANRFLKNPPPPQLPTPEPSKTFGDWLDEWYELYKKPVLRPASLSSIKFCVKKYLQEMRPLELSKITTRDIQKHLMQIPSNRQRVITKNIINNCLTKAVKCSLITTNPCAAVEIQKDQYESQRALTNEETKNLLAAIKGHKYESLIKFYIYTGVRRNEALAVKWKDIDFSNGIIHISASLDITGAISKTKTKTSVRNIPLLPELRKILLTMPQTNEFVFYDFKPNAINKAFQKICKSLQLEKITVHSLRHSFATRCSNAGIDNKTIMKWLGHSKSEITNRIYIHVLPEHEKKEALKLDEYFDE